MNEPTQVDEYGAIVIGGGFYGCCVALIIRNYFDRVLLIEKESDLLLRASAINQARVHAGYHYPRSLMTAVRSFVNFPRFILDFKGCIYDQFEKIYAIASQGSKVNAYQFQEMFKRIGAPVQPASNKYKHLFNMDLIEEIFSVRELAFDAVKLRQIMKQRLEKANVIVRYGREVQKVVKGDNERIFVLLSEGGRLSARKVFNCTYSQINNLLRNSCFDLLPLKHEVTEMPLLRMPDELSGTGITIMDGPFFSLMPYPSLGIHSMHHVRYTPHYSWLDQQQFINGHLQLAKARPESHWPFMIKDAARYIPLIKEAEYINSLYEVKTILVQNEIDDGRPILFRKDYGISNFSTVMGGKLDNIYDVLEIVGELKEYSRDSSKSLFHYLQS